MNKSVLKVLLVGDTNVGKTSLRNQYVHKRFTSSYKATIGADFITKELVLDDASVVLQLWDTAGQERFSSLTSAWYRGADGLILVYDTSNPTSLTNLSKWLLEFLDKSGVKNLDSFPICVIGNKVDLLDNAINGGGGGKVSIDKKTSTFTAESNELVSRELDDGTPVSRTSVEYSPRTSTASSSRSQGLQPLHPEIMTDARLTTPAHELSTRLSRLRKAHLSIPSTPTNSFARTISSISRKVSTNANMVVSTLSRSQPTSNAQSSTQIHPQEEEELAPMGKSIALNQLDIPVYLASAKYGLGVEDAFLFIGRNGVQRLQKVQLHMTDGTASSSGTTARILRIGSLRGQNMNDGRLSNTNKSCCFK